MNDHSFSDHVKFIIGIFNVTIEQHELLRWWLVVKNLSAHAGDIRDVDLILGSGRSPGGGHGNSLQYSCLGIPTDRGAWGL